MNRIAKINNLFVKFFMSVFINYITEYPNSLAIGCPEVRAITISSHIDNLLEALIPLSYTSTMLALVVSEAILEDPLMPNYSFHIVILRCEDTLFQ